MTSAICFDVLTLFPGIFEGFLSESVLKAALTTQKIEVRLHNMRDWAEDKHATMDDRPFGGGPGMLLKVDRVVPCVEEIQRRQKPGRLLMFTPQGRCFNQMFAEELATEQRIVMLCGRYEGFDERVAEILKPEEVSIGDYILNGGEVAAMAVIETVMRLVPGILGDEDSNRFDSFSTGNRILDCAHYTRPREYRGFSVPEILLSGNHAEIARWRKNNSLQQTKEKRPDLLAAVSENSHSENSPLKTEPKFSQISIIKNQNQCK
ncbi:MAG: tRNA (guanosine(37)-N1)-methyltransferase TrmD [Planctomycetaceae bacterium]|jgi:tRNA (guanine37-N1)-methyltransferase|nr:tRNA (guanosine(37)-N1)-methyltransferase TrmD [Planctomycetaceae bacterium]